MGGIFLTPLLSPFFQAFSTKDDPTVNPAAQKVVGEAINNTYPPVVGSSGEMTAWQLQIMGVKTTAQAVILGELIERGVIKNPSDIDKYQAIWQEGLDTKRVVLYETPDPNDEEMMAAFSIRDNILWQYPTEMLLEHLRIRQSPTVSASAIIELLKSASPDIENEIVAFLEKDYAAGFPWSGNFHDFLTLIPNRSVLEKLIFGNQGIKLLEDLDTNWRQIGSALSQIINGEDRRLYTELLGKNLAEPVMSNNPKTAFNAPIMVTDLTNMERTLLPGTVRVIDDQRVLYAFDYYGETFAAVVNPKDTASIKFLFRKAFPPDNQYLFYYFPKMTLTDKGWQVSLNYEKRGRFAENVIGHSDYDNNLQPAIDLFKRAYQQEDNFRATSKSSFTLLFSPSLLAKIKAEPPLAVPDIVKLMKIMADSDCRTQAPAMFGITQSHYDHYENNILAILESGREMTREEFLAKAIEACDGRAALAGVISFNVLLRFSESLGNNALFTRYPNAFKMIPNVQDQIGSIYHFMGCFFGAYALQRWLVDRYHTDSNFHDQVKSWSSQLRTELIKEGFSTFNEAAFLKLLIFIQFSNLTLGGERGKEIMSLAGVFYEEVLEDREVSPETEEDIKGIAAGHAFYEIVSGKELKKTEWNRQVFIEEMVSFVTTGTSTMQKVLRLLLNL